MSLELKNKLNANAKHFRYLSRAQTFNRNRKSVEDVDYLKYYTLERKQLIINSLQGPIPMVLPPLAPDTISFYRRSNKAVFRTKMLQSLQIDGHMLYESLWILASLEEKEFQNYQAVSKQFQQDLHIYLSVLSTDIREMAIMVAGNKILGKQSDIHKIVEGDPNQLWVLINHIYQKKISFVQMLKYISGNYQIIYKTLYQLTNNKEDETITSIMKDQNVIQNIIQALNSNNQQISKYAIRIIGNIVSEEGEYTDTLHKYKLVQHTFPLLMSSNQQIRKDTCWLLSNLCCDRISATCVMRNQKVMAKLVNLFSSQGNMYIQQQITRIFAGIAHYGQKYQSFQLLAHQDFLCICYNHLCIDYNDLTYITLALIRQLLQLGQNYKSQDQKNMFCFIIERIGGLQSQINQKSYSQDDEISTTSLEIINNFLQKEQL